MLQAVVATNDDWLKQRLPQGTHILALPFRLLGIGSTQLLAGWELCSSWVCLQTETFSPDVTLSDMCADLPFTDVSQ